MPNDSLIFKLQLDASEMERQIDTVAARLDRIQATAEEAMLPHWFLGFLGGLASAVALKERVSRRALLFPWTWRKNGPQA